MLVLDLNLLLYAVNRDAPLHTKARTWLEKTLNGDRTVALPWVVILGFLRLSTHPRVFRAPLTPENALRVADGWLACRNVRVLEAGREHWRILTRLLKETGTAGNLTTDAHLAALAIENGAELHSTDADFGRFRQLAWINPIQSNPHRRHFT